MFLYCNILFILVLENTFLATTIIKIFCLKSKNLLLAVSFTFSVMYDSRYHFEKLKKSLKNTKLSKKKTIQSISVLKLCTS